MAWLETATDENKIEYGEESRAERFYDVREVPFITYQRIISIVRYGWVALTRAAALAQRDVVLTALPNSDVRTTSVDVSRQNDAGAYEVRVAVETVGEHTVIE